MPFLIAVSGLGPGRLEGPASLLDVLPTGVDLAGFDLVEAHYPGRSIVRLPDDRPLWLSCFDELRCLARLQGHEKYIYFFDDQPEELYDLSQDPLERVNLAAERRDIVERRRRETLAWRSAMFALYDVASR